MRKWWRRFKNSRGWDFTKISYGKSFVRYSKRVGGIQEGILVVDPNGCYQYICRYCGHIITFPWRETHLAYHNMQRHIRAKHLDVL